jgi:prophage antirepressor-like protein
MSEFKTLANPFQFANLDVRTAVDEDGEVFFFAKDVCEVLEISWTGRGNTLRSIPETWVMVSYHETTKGERETIFINEAAVYKLIFRSNKPKAEEFANFVCSEVLPTIRKHGFYGKVPPKDYVAVVKLIAQLTSQIVETKNAFERQTLIKHLRDLHNMAGSKMPEIKLIAQDIEQADLFEGGNHGLS